MDKKKTIYQATFEESESLVSDTAVKRAVEQSQSKVVNKRLFGILFIFFLLYLIYSLFQFAEISEPNNLRLFVLEIPLFWIISSVIVYVPYLIIVLKNKNKKKISSSYYYNVVSILCLIIFLSFMFMFTLDIVNSVLNAPWVRIFYIILLAFFILNRNLALNKNLEKKLYGKENKNTNIVEFFKKYQKFFGPFGAIVIILQLIFSFFGGSEINEGDSLFSTILVVLSPFIIFACSLVTIYLKDEALIGYYINKYSEEYRLKYGYSTLEWYGKKSNQNKKQNFS